MRIILAAFLLFGALPSNAQIIVNPDGDLAKFVVMAPPNLEKPLNLALNVRARGATKKIDPAVTYKVTEGNICLSSYYKDIHSRVNSDANRSQLCVQMEKGKTYIIRMARLDLKWNKEVFEVDLQRDPGTIQVKGAHDLFSVSLGFRSASRELALFPKKYEVSVATSLQVLKDLEVKTLELQPGEERQLSLVYPDKRGTITVQSPKRVFPVSTHEVSSTHIRLNSHRILRLVRKNGLIGQAHFPNIYEAVKTNSSAPKTAGLDISYRFITPETLELKSRVFPILKEELTQERYQLVVNGTIVDLNPTTGYETLVKTESLNVEDINGDTKGVFQVYKGNGTGKWQRIRYADLRRGARIDFATIISNTPTKTSIDVTFGQVYLVKTFWKDPVTNNLVLTDSEEFDLR